MPHYAVRVTCSNCGHDGRVSIPTGTLVRDTPCPICECQSLGRAPFSSEGIRVDSEEDPEESPEAPRRCGPDLARMWGSGQRVEYVISPLYGPETTRPGVVVGVYEELRLHQFLRVRFDDGEERRINPDVMRHVSVQQK